MRLRMIAVGERMPGWVETGFHEYAKRLQGEFRLELCQVAAARRGRGGDAARWKREEAGRLRAATRRGSLLVALDEHGRCESTEALASRLHDWQGQGREVSLLVGGPGGLDPELLSETEWRWSLSPLTFPHPLVRVIVAEQIYRAASLLANHPYHRG